VRTTDVYQERITCDHFQGLLLLKNLSNRRSQNIPVLNWSWMFPCFLFCRLRKNALFYGTLWHFQTNLGWFVLCWYVGINFLNELLKWKKTITSASTLTDREGDVERTRASCQSIVRFHDWWFDTLHTSIWLQLLQPRFLLCTLTSNGFVQFWSCFNERWTVQD